MKLYRYLLAVAIAACGLISSAAYALPAGLLDVNGPEAFDERDFEAVTNFIKSKRCIPLREKSCDLMLSGDVRLEWDNVMEKSNGIRRRGQSAQRSIEAYQAAPPPENEFFAEANLMFDYKADCTWAVMHLRFSNRAGTDINPRGCCDEIDTDVGTIGCDRLIRQEIEGDPDGGHGSGTFDHLNLLKAYFGYNIFEECNSRLDIEIGRRPLYEAFDSRVQFRSRFDGILLRYSNCFECVGDFYVNAGPFVVDYTVNHYAWVLETGLLNICDYGIDFKYSFIDWEHHGDNRCNRDDPIGYLFQVSQWILQYHFDPEWLCTRAKVYGAFLWNSAAPQVARFEYSRQDKGWYVGFLFGEVRREGDWSFDINYQWVEAQAIPDFDVSGIGRGNVFLRPITVDTSWGNTNYQGARAEGLYALTDNITLNPIWEYSTQIKETIGGDHKFAKWQLKFIYAF